MSFESAQKILAMYTGENQRRLDEAMKFALMEAEQEGKSVIAQREALTEVLKAEQKALNDYIKTLQSARNAQRKGQYELARSNIIAAQKAQAKYDRELAAYQAEQERIATANEGVKDKAAQEADKMYLASGQDMASISEIIDKLGARLSKDDASSAPSQVLSLMKSEKFRDKLTDLVAKANDKKTYRDLKGNSTSVFRLSNMYNNIIEQVANKAGISVDDEKLDVVKDFILKTNQTGAEGQSGAFRELGGNPLSEDEIQAAQAQYIADYVTKKGKKGRLKEPTEGKEIKVAAVSKGERILVRRARPVLDALSAGDDTPYEITAEERAALPQSAFDAYAELKDRYRVNPQVVNVDDAVLLDDIALSRALRVEQLRAESVKPLKKPRRAEDIMYRAGEIADPKGYRNRQDAEDVGNRPVHEQKYFATERKALELSNQDDDYIRSMGTPEAFGVAKWKETFDGTKLTDQYANIVANIEQEFKTPEDQLRALAAFNSRALAHSAAKTPVMFRGRETNAYYISALEAMEPKGNNKK